MNKYKVHKLGDKALVLKQDTTKTYKDISDEEYATDLLYWSPVDMYNPADVSAAKEALGDAWPFK